MEAFHFLRPFWLLVLVPLSVLVWRLATRRRGVGNLSELCDPALLAHLIVERPSGTVAASGLWLTALAGALGILALAGPTWERVPMPVFRSDDALVIALDLSVGMDATDLKPSRLDRARFKITDLLQARKDGQTALVIYAGDAFVVTPLTDDGATIQSQLSALTTALPPVQGQRADLALELAARLLQQSGVRTGNILLMTGDVDLGRTLETVRRVRALGFRVSVLGVGTEAGGPVQTGRGGLWKDANGNILVPKLDSEGLRTVANDGGGVYREISSGSSDVERFLSAFDRPTAAAEVSTDSQVRLEQWIEAGPWLVLAILPLAALAFRRGGILALLILLAPLPKPVQAFEWRDLWVKRDLAAQKAFGEQRFDEAASQFGNDAWRGAALYRAGKFDEAVKALQPVDTADGWYNRGNALAQLQRYPEAIEAYNHALQRDPAHADAKYNKELIESALKKKEEKRQQKSDSGKDAQDSGKPSPKQSNEGQDAEKGEQEKDDRSEQQASQEPSPADGGEKEEKDQQADQGSSNATKDANADSGADKQRGNEKSAAPAEKAAGTPEKGSPESPQTLEATPEPGERAEAQQANEQWLRRIPDDPAGLLKRKFAWQYRQRQRANEDNGQ